MGESLGTLPRPPEPPREPHVAARKCVLSVSTSPVSGQAAWEGGRPAASANNRRLFPHSSDGRMSQIEVWRGRLLARAVFRARRRPPSHCVLVRGVRAEGESKRAWGGSSLASLLIRTLMGSDQAHPPKPRFTLITSSEASLPNGYPGGQDVSIRTVGSTQILVL